MSIQTIYCVQVCLCFTVQCNCVIRRKGFSLTKSLAEWVISFLFHTHIQCMSVSESSGCWVKREKEGEARKKEKEKEWICSKCSWYKQAHYYCSLTAGPKSHGECREREACVLNRYIYIYIECRGIFHIQLVHFILCKNYGTGNTDPPRIASESVDSLRTRWMVRRSILSWQEEWQ